MVPLEPPGDYTIYIIHKKKKTYVLIAVLTQWCWVGHIWRESGAQM